MRIGILGGTFDPPHVGHLLTALDAIEALALDQLLFIPAAEQPLKVGLVAAHAKDRLAMVRLLAGADPKFAVDPIEVDRGGLSYTVDTLRQLRDRWPGPAPLALFLLIGADVAATLPKWRDPEGIAALAQIVMVTREGGSEGLPPGVARRLWTRRVDVSSTEVRSRVRAGRSIRGFVTDPVAEYIALAGLYQ